MHLSCSLISPLRLQSAFLEFAKIVSAQVSNSDMFEDSLRDKACNIEVVAMHPQMVNREGQPDYGRRSPHPALLFKLRSYEVNF